MLDDRVVELIKKKFNSGEMYPQQCEALSLEIEESTGKSIGTTTLKRMLGFVQGVAVPRASSMDIIALYLGYENYDELICKLDGKAMVSDFLPINRVLSENLCSGDVVHVSYEPNRRVTFRYIDDNFYDVIESIGSKLKEGDRVKVRGFYVGVELVAESVVREGVCLGPYRGAKQGGLTTVERSEVD